MEKNTYVSLLIKHHQPLPYHYRSSYPTLYPTLYATPHPTLTLSRPYIEPVGKKGFNFFCKICGSRGARWEMQVQC